MSRVVVTGMGVVCPLGTDVDAFADALLAGRSAVGPITHFDATGLTTRIGAEVRAVLEETKALLVAKHGFAPEVQQAYLEKNLLRFGNPYLSDTVARVGRQPLRKLSRHERFVGPAAELAERGLSSAALVRTMGAALAFDVPDDPQCAELKTLLAKDTADEFVVEVTGLDAEHPLYAQVLEVVTAAKK